MSRKKTLARLRKRAKSLQRMREKWKNGEAVKVKNPAIQTRNSIRALRGGLPESGKR